ncbi:type II toxin-antitoxin system Phd/YefM family antitoxin [candidate division KSB1 bacterium]|nr:type II toxin-antitoxin system Phd/YefM family antitoxin [candidate division KSB1 bacterium]RQW10760.1 MAG: type II toxin-antitoxin system Phd/YefM family antitoxin [candidate division KSB1 bacterium]
MKYSEAVKPISYFKAHAAEVVRDVVDNNKTMIITQNGEAKVVLQDVRAYEELQASLALLKMLALSNKSLGEGKAKTAAKAFKDIRSRIRESQSA